MTNEIKLTYDRETLENEVHEAWAKDPLIAVSPIGIISFTLSHLEKSTKNAHHIEIAEQVCKQIAKAALKAALEGE